MATVTKPIALDESLNTTELSSRNVADVLAQELSAVATAIGGIAVPSADHVSYDNSGSGLSATDVQDAIDELSSEKADSSSLATVATSGDYDDLINKPTIPTVNDATLTIQKNGTTVATFSANASSNASANITVPTTTSELTNNSDFVSDASYVHTDNNFTTAEKTKLSGIESGAEVNVQSDWNQTDNTADDFIKNKPSSEVKSATDTFTTVNGGLLEECIIDLEPVQSGSGDPSPDNIRPISGHTEVDLLRDGKNLCSGIEQGSWYTSGIKVTSNIRVRSADFIHVEEGEKYAISKTSIGMMQAYIHFFKADKTTLVSSISWGYMPRVITVPTSASYMVFLICYSNDTNITPSDVGNVQVEKNDHATDYVNYLGTLYTVQIGQTVYGGTVDLVSGVMTVTHGYKDMGSLAWSAPSATYQYFQTIISDMVNTYTTVTSNGHFMCSNYGYAQITGSTTNEGMCLATSYLRVRDNDYATVDAFTTAMSGVQFVYELATPITIQLTPQQIEALPKENNLSTPLDGQSIDSVKYREVFVFDDVEKVVNLRVPISMLGTDESGRTTASQSYASGDYFYKDGYMCKALTSISAGATLTLNTNYSQGTLADVLKAIENA